MKIKLLIFGILFCISSYIAFEAFSSYKYNPYTRKQDYYESGGSGSVTSVDMLVPTGLSISGNPITTSGTLTLTYTAGYEGLVTTDKTNWNNTYNYVNQDVTNGSSPSFLGLTLNSVGYSFPASDGTNGYVLTTNGAGTLSWGAGGAGSQTPWTSNIDGAGYNLSNVGILTVANIISTSTSADNYFLGKVGVGTTTPAYPLDVYGNGRFDGDIRTTGTFYGDTWSSATNNSMNIQPSGDVDDFFSFKTPAHRPTIKREGGKFIYIESSNVYDVGISARADDTYSGTLNYEKDNHMMTMLGKNSPLGFKANSDYDDYIKIQTASNIPEITVASSSAFKINAGGTNDLLLNHAGGNVGIGTSSPNYILDVNGNVNINGNLIVNNSISHQINDDILYLYGGTGNLKGSGIRLYGQNEATASSSIKMLIGSDGVTRENSTATFDIYSQGSSGSSRIFRLTKDSYLSSISKITTTNASTTLLTVSGDSWLNTIKSGTWNGTALADAYVSNTLTVDGYMQDTDIDTFAELQSWAVGYTDNNTTYTGGTGLTLTDTTFSVDTSQNISTLSNLTTNGFVITSGGTGALSIDTNTYLTGNQSITLSGDITGSGATAITTTIGADKILESMLKSVNAPTDEYVLTYESTTGDFEWQASAGGGDVSKVGTPVDNQVGVWTGDGTIEGTAGLTYDGSNLLFTGDIGSTGAYITKAWLTDLIVTNAIAGSITGNAVTVTGFTPASGSLTLAGADALTLTTSAATNVTLPTSGTLVNSTVATLSSLTSIGTIGTGTWQATDVGVEYGGTGASTLLDHGILAGSGTGAITALTVGTNGQLLVGSTGADPVFATLNCDNGLTCTTGAGTLEIDADTASDTVVGVVEFATIAETTTGTDATRAVTPDGLAGSTIFGRKTVELIPIAFDADTATGDGIFYFHIPASLNGMNLVSVHGLVVTAGTTGTTDWQIHNLTDTQDMLSTVLTIDTAETGSNTAATPAVINTTYDDVATNDVIRLDCDAISTTAAKGTIISLEFQLP